ncbi:MAG: phosphatidylserine decarboxylase [Syntrophorhabdaceae bacterium]
MRESFIAREGLRIIIPSLVLTAVLVVGGFFYLSLLVFCFAFFCLYFFRNPSRHSEGGDDTLISPADGKVLDISEMTEHEFFGGDVIRIAIFMSPADVHVNRAPCSGRVMVMKHVAGKFAMAFGKDIEIRNEKNYIFFENDGERVLVCQIAGFLARRIIPYVKVEERVERGQPIGIIAFGSRVDIYFHKGYEPVVNLHARVKAGETVLARKCKKEV